MRSGRRNLNLAARILAEYEDESWLTVPHRLPVLKFGDRCALTWRDGTVLPDEHANIEVTLRDIVQAAF